MKRSPLTSLIIEVLLAVTATIHCAAAQLTILSNTPSAPATSRSAEQIELERYREELATFRSAFGGTREIPGVSFFLFGMGQRTKLLYKDGVLLDARAGKELRRWHVVTETIVPPGYMVALVTDRGAVRIREDERAVWIEEDGRTHVLAGTEASVRLPAFERYRYPQIMRVLHQELLINVVDGLPVPNFFVYSKPWYRDGAMMAMCFRETGNLDLIRDWITKLAEPYDRNNAGQTEADNLGQALFLISLVTNKQHTLVARIRQEAHKWEVKAPEGVYIQGNSDFAQHPVYQTKWLKFGLRSLGLSDPYEIPPNGRFLFRAVLVGLQGCLCPGKGCLRPRPVSLSRLGLRPFSRNEQESDQQS